MPRTRMEVLNEKIRHHEAELNRAYARQRELEGKLETANGTERLWIKREIAQLQTQIDYHQPIVSEAELEKFSWNASEAKGGDDPKQTRGKRKVRS